MFRPTWEGFMREFKLNSNNKHVATDWGLHVDLTVRADALHEPNVSLLEHSEHFYKIPCFI